MPRATREFPETHQVNRKNSSKLLLAAPGLARRVRHPRPTTSERATRTPVQTMSETAFAGGGVADPEKGARIQGVGRHPNEHPAAFPALGSASAFPFPVVSNSNTRASVPDVCLVSRALTEVPGGRLTARTNQAGRPYAAAASTESPHSRGGGRKMKRFIKSKKGSSFLRHSSSRLRLRSARTRTSLVQGTTRTPRRRSASRPRLRSPSRCDWRPDVPGDTSKRWPANRRPTRSTTRAQAISS